MPVIQLFTDLKYALARSVKSVHQNYVGIDTEKNPYFLSIVSHESGNKSTPLYRAMLFRKQVCTLFCFCFFFIFCVMNFYFIILFALRVYWELKWSDIKKIEKNSVPYHFDNANHTHYENVKHFIIKKKKITISYS